MKPAPPIIDPCAAPPASVSDPQASRVLAAAAGHHDLDGTWLNGRQAAVLSIDVSVGAPLPGSGTGCGESLRLAAAVTVKTRDGIVDGQADAIRFDVPWRATVEVALSGLAEAYAHPDPSLPPLVGTDAARADMGLAVGATPTLVLAVDADGTLAQLIVDQQRVVGAWSSNGSSVPPRIAAPYVVPPELVADCEPAADYTGAPGQYTSFATSADATAALVGTWIRCRSYGGPGHAGFEVAADGSWQMLAWQDGGLVTRGGIQREGAIEAAIDVSTADGPGFFQVNLRGPAVWWPSHTWQDRLIRGDDTAPPTFGASVYVRSNRAVAAALNPYAPGQRGGAAACAVAETGTIDPDLGAAMESTLAGTWTLCSGELLEGYGGLSFDGRGGVTFLDASGQPVGTSTYRAVHPTTMPVLSPRATNLVLPDGRDWSIIFSRLPLKLWIAESGPRTTLRSALYSAVP